MDKEEILSESIPMIAEDARSARVRLGITTARAARRVGLDPVRYRSLEKGTKNRSYHVAGELLSVARRMGLQSVRMCYVEELDMHMKVDLASGGPITVFVDWLELGFLELRRTHSSSEREIHDR